jgi:hypothetical protein
VLAPSVSAHENGRAPTARPDQTVLPERTKMIIAKRGGTGPAAKLNPDPRTPHKPKQKVQVMCR